MRFLRLFLTVWLNSTGPQGRLLTDWAPIHMICLFARRAPAILENNQEAAEHHSALSDCKEKGWVKFFNRGENGKYKSQKETELDEKMPIKKDKH